MRTLFSVTLLLCLGACSLINKAAEQKVLITPTLFNDVGLKFLTLNPCINDTTIFQGATHTDTQYIPQAYPAMPGDLQSYADTTTTDTAFIKYRSLRVDTLKIRINHTDTAKIVDNAALNRTRDSVAALHIILASATASTVTAQAQAAAVHGKYTTLIWIDIAVIVVIVAAVVIFFLIKTGII